MIIIMIIIIAVVDKRRLLSVWFFTVLNKIMLAKKSKFIPKVIQFMV